MADLQDKVTVVTGACGLIGQAFGKAILEAGGILSIADVDESRGQSFERELQKSFGASRVGFWKTDITSKDSVTNLLEGVHGRWGRIDAVVNNAFPRNRNYGRHFFDVTYDDFCEHLRVHVGGYFLVSQEASRYFLKQGRGNIVNMGSMYGVIPPRFEIYEGTTMTSAVEYSAIKAGVIHLTKYMAKYFKGKGIRVNSISPGGVFDRQDPKFVANYNRHGLSKGMLNPSDLTGTLVFLLSDASALINGQNIVVDDGWSLS